MSQLRSSRPINLLDHARSITIGGVLIVTSFTLVGQTRQRFEEPTERAKTGTITGRVLNESGQPLVNAAVLVRAFGSAGQGHSVSTDQDGTFQVSGLDRVAYLISASLPTYTMVPREPSDTQVNYYRVGDTVTLVLTKGGVVTGSVTAQSGEPIVDVSVRAQMIRDGNDQPSRYGPVIRERATDDRGVYRIYGLPTGTYVVLAGGATYFSGPDINPYETDAPTYSPSSTRDTAAEVNVRSGEETANVDIRYRGEPSHIVSGSASGPQAASPSAFNVTLTSTADQWSRSFFQPSGSRGFVFYGVPDGEYDVTAQSLFSVGELSISEPKRIKVRGRDITGIELITKPLASINGRLVLEESKAVDCNGKRRPLFAETLVSAWHNEKDASKDQQQFIWGLGRPSYPNEMGDILFRNLTPGQYYFIAQFAAKYWYLKSISLQSSGAKSAQTNRPVDAARNWTALKSGDRLSGLIITLAEGAASLRGQITLSGGASVPARLFVYLLPAERESSEDVLRFFAAPVGSDGKVILNNVAPGRYWIVAQPAIDNALSPSTKLRLPDETETRAKLLRDGEAAKIEIVFKPCQNVIDYQLPLKTPLQ